MKLNFPSANGCENQSVPYLLSERMAWGAVFSSCWIINGFETEILKTEVLRRLSDMQLTFARKMKYTKTRKHVGGQWEIFFWSLWLSLWWFLNTIPPRGQIWALHPVCVLTSVLWDICLSLIKLGLIDFSLQTCFNCNTDIIWEGGKRL